MALDRPAAWFDEPWEGGTPAPRVPSVGVAPVLRWVTTLVPVGVSAVVPVVVGWLDAPVVPFGGPVVGGAEGEGGGGALGGGRGSEVEVGVSMGIGPLLVRVYGAHMPSDGRV